MSSGRGNRNTKDRTKNPGTPAQTKNEGPPNNIKPTPEQVRIAQIIRTDDNQESLMRQLMDMTQKSEEECALALHDCQNDVSRAALLLVEGNGDQGEWKEMGKKKKRQASHTQPPSKSDTAVDHLSELPDSRRDRSRDMEAGDRPDKSEYQPRRGGRRSNGGPPPRLARGRARERGSFGDRIEDAEEKENGMGFGSRDRHGERGRGRGRGGIARSTYQGQSNRRGRGSRAHRGGQGQRYEKGPHIDTWTNDQADSAENVPGWGETWNEDLADDSWTGNLNETKVFTASTTKASEEPAATTPPGNEAPVPGQRVNVASLLPNLAKEKQMESYINDYNQQATESIKNSIGIGNDSSRQHYGHQAGSVPSLMNSTSQSNSWAAASPAAAVGTPASTAAQVCMHRPKPLKSKLPPPSKIPQSAVEMPGHQNVPPIDIHFGLDEGDSVPNYEFTVGGSMGTSRGSSAIYSSANSPSSSSSNHVAPQPPSAKVTAEAPANSTPASMISAPTSQAPPPSLDQPPSRSDFQSAGFPTPKKEGPPTPAPASRMSPPADMAFPPSQQPEPKPGPALMPPPLAAAQSASHSQGSSAPVTESATLVSYAQSTGSYSYKSNSTQGYASTHTTNSQVGSYQNQFQPSPKTYGGSGGSQFQSGGSQYPGSQQASSQYSSSQYPSSAGQNQFQGYQGGSVGSFQGTSTGSSSLYQNPTPASSFQPASASYHSRDSQAGSGPSSTGSGFQGQGAGLSSPTSQAQGSYGAPAFSSASHQPSLPSGGGSLAGNKLSDSLTKMTLKESAMDSHTTSQYDHSTSSTTSTGLTTTSTGALATGTTTVAVAASTVSPAASSNSSRNSSNLPSAAASKLATMPPGMQMPAAAAAAAVGAQYILGNPAFYGVQQPMFGFDEMMLQQRLPLTGNYYDHLQYPVPTTHPGREVPPLNVPYSASADNSKLTRVDAQSPNPTSQQSHNAPPQQTHYVPNYIYYQHMMPSAAPGFPQYQQVYPMPPVTNTAHAGSTASSQFQKNFSHGYSNKGYDDQTQGPDFAKTGYGGSQSQSKGSVTSRSGATGDMAATGYGKTHPQQAFDKQGFHGGTPPPFNLPLAAASQATPMAAPNTPYGYMPVMPHQPPQPHSQMTLQHHPMQDSTPGSSRVGGSQGSSMGKTKGYGGYWNN